MVAVVAEIIIIIAGGVDHILITREEEVVKTKFALVTEIWVIEITMMPEGVEVAVAIIIIAGDGIM